MELLVVFGTLALLILSIGIIFFVVLYQRRVIAHQIQLKKINEEKELELIRASITSEEQERNRIAAELHDDVVATLASARLYLYKNDDKPYKEESILYSKGLLDESINKIRNISHKLQPVSLQHLGLEVLLQSHVETINRSGAVSFEFIGDGKLARLSDYASLAAYRISQELITNILKHSSASHIIMHTSNGDTGISIKLSHDGKGMSHEEYEEQIFKKGSIGLKNILNRLKSINAGISYSQVNEQWFNTIVSIPFTS